MSLSATPNVAARHSSHAQLMTVIYMYFFLELPERIVVCVRYPRRILEAGGCNYAYDYTFSIGQIVARIVLIY